MVTRIMTDFLVVRNNSRFAAFFQNFLRQNQRLNEIRIGKKL